MNGGISYNKSDLSTSMALSAGWGRGLLTGPNFGPTFGILSAAIEINTVTHNKKENKWRRRKKKEKNLSINPCLHESLKTCTLENLQLFQVTPEVSLKILKACFVQYAEAIKIKILVYFFSNLNFVSKCLIDFILLFYYNSFMSDNQYGRAAKSKTPPSVTTSELARNPLQSLMDDESGSLCMSPAEHQNTKCLTQQVS